jgi:FkbM family methyltransferase
MTLKRAIAKFIPTPFVHPGRYVLDPGYRRKSRELSRLRAMPPYQRTVVDFMGKPLEIVSAPSFLDMYGEIFEQGIYRFSSSQLKPYIIDGGANIGLSILYFKGLYPGCEVVAFEADEEIFAVLQNNIQRWGYDDVELICRALWSSETMLSFASEGSYAGRVSVPGDITTRSVQTLRLRSYLNRQVSLLKMDIEGAETEVLRDCADLLGNVENMFIEYHSFPNVPQSLDEILNIFSRAGFRFHIHTRSHSPQPLLSRTLAFGMDMQLNIFAFRENT